MKTKLSAIRCLPAALGAAAALACGAAVAQNLSEVSAASFLDPIPRIVSGPATASLGLPSVGPVVETGRGVDFAGQAAAASQTLRAGITARAYPCCLEGDWDTAYLTSRFVSEIVVGSGNTGLLGAPTALSVNLQLSGRLTAGVSVTPPNVSISSTAEGQSHGELRYLVYDLDAHGAATELTPILDVFLSASATYRTLDAQEGSNDPSYTAWASAANGIFVSQAGFSTWLSPDGTEGGYDTARAGFHSFDLLNDGFRFQLDTAVGHRLRFEGALTSSVTGLAAGDWWGGWYARSDFGHTFDAEVSADTPGLELLGYTPGVHAAAVPEPAPLALFLAALSLLALGRLLHRSAWRPGSLSVLGQKWSLAPTQARGRQGP
mgnify:CR=1 FL=1